MDTKRVAQLLTESRNPDTVSIDLANPEEILYMINDQDEGIAKAVRNEIPYIAGAVEKVVSSVKNGGRIIYVGAGTSGRIAVVDAAEWYPTFGFPSERILALIAGGEKAISHSVEGAEDDECAAIYAINELHLTNNDVVIGIAASGRTPYVIAALKQAKSDGADTVAISNNKDAVISKYASLAIEVQTGPETITGSTRMKAGTSQKMILNMISTAAMIQLGKTYSNLMVDLVPNNEKLMYRSIRLITIATGVDEITAQKKYDESGKNIKAAILAILAGIDCQQALALLDKHHGMIQRAVEEAEKKGQLK